ncbi:MAG: glycosyltransferase family 2 protein [Deltaproteobacteria bacterium]|nr:glycosyltransferase family 2 protein [Deltaproteobacteria bacterium]
MKGISVIVPVYNEEDNVAESYAEISRVLRSMGREYEILFVDDGSRDQTLARLQAVSRGDTSVRIIEFRRNFGQTAAMAAGFDHARLDIVVTLDGDLQNDPAEIPAMVAKLEEGYDLVAGWRKNRQDKFLSRKLPSKMANWLISHSTNVSLHDYGCTLKVMTIEVAKGIKLYGEMHRFIPALAAEMGAKIAEVPVNHRARRFGVSKYGISRTLRVLLDLITVKFLLGYSKRPIHLFGTAGLLSGGLGFLLLLRLTYERFFLHVPMGSRPAMILGVMLVIIGLQFLVFGLLAEVLARTYYESQEKRIYVVRRLIESREPSSPFTDRLNAGESAWNRKVAN